MSNTLTKEQEKLVDDYGLKMLQNGVKYGIKTDRKKANQSIETLYRKYLEIDPPKEIIYVDSPEAAVDACAKSNSVDPKTLTGEIMFINLLGSRYYWHAWVPYYWAGINFLGETAGVDQDLIDDLNEHEAMLHQLHAILPCENICYVIEYPKMVSIKNDDLDKFILHRESGLAVEYNDGTGFAWLNGVEVPDWVAVEKPSKLSVKKLLAEANVDIRREGLARIPLEKLIKQTGAKLLDKVKDLKIGPWWDYQLYDIDLKDNKKRRCLRMFDVASKKYPFERVGDHCDTVLQALAMRDGEKTYIIPKKRT